MAQFLPTPISATQDPLEIEREMIEERAQPLQLGPEGLHSSINTGQAVAGKLGEIEETRKATEFEALLQSGEEGMKLALQDAQAQGVDLTGVPDPKLYLRSTDDMATWYSFLAAKLEAHKKRASRREAFEQISGEDPKGGYAKLVGTGDLAPQEAAKEVRKIDFNKRLQEYVSGSRQMVADDAEVTPEGATVINVNEYAPIKEESIASLRKAGKTGLTDEIVAAINSAAEKLKIPANLLLGIASRETVNFNASGAGSISKNGARGLGQLLSKNQTNKNQKDLSIGPKMFKLAQEQGLIGKDVEYNVAVADPEMNMIMTGLLFKENLKLKGVDGDVRKALLAHRAGPKGMSDILSGKPHFVTNDDGTKEDISPDSKDWLGDVMGTAFGDGVPGLASDGSPDLFTLEGIDIELERLRQDTEFTATPEAKVAIDVLTKRKDALIKERDAIAKDKGKGEKKSADVKVGEMIKLVKAMAMKAGASGIIVGGARKLLGWFNIDAEAATLDQFSGLLASQVAKGVGGESGRLTDQDRTYALASLPKVTDTPEVRATKFAILDAIVENINAAGEGDYDAARRLRKAVFINATKFGKQMTKEELMKEWKVSPSDELLEAFIWSNGKDADDPNTVAKLRAELEKKPGVKPKAAPPGAITIQSPSTADAVPTPAVQPSIVAPPLPAGTDTTGTTEGLGFESLPAFEKE